MRSKLTTVIILLAGIIAAAGIYHYLPLTKSSPTTTEVQPTQTVTVATFAQRTIPTTAHAYGSIISPRSVEEDAKTNGVVSAVYFKAGQTLQKGDLLFKVESNNTTNQLKQLAANLQLAKTTYDNYVKANELAPGSISQLDINTKKADYLTALTAYQVAKSQFYIKAPVHGIASDTELAIGSSVSENDTLMTVIDLSSIELKYTLPSQYSHLVAKGQDLTFIANNHKHAYAAKVSYISPSMTLEDDNITLRATFDTPPPLKPNTLVISRKSSTLHIRLLHYHKPYSKAMKLVFFFTPLKTTKSHIHPLLPAALMTKVLSRSHTASPPKRRSLPPIRQLLMSGNTSRLQHNEMGTFNPKTKDGNLLKCTSHLSFWSMLLIFHSTFTIPLKRF